MRKKRLNTANVKAVVEYIEYLTAVLHLISPFVVVDDKLRQQLDDLHDK